MVIFPAASFERLSEAAAPFLALPNVHRVYLDQLCLLDSPNRKFWLIALIVADTESIAPIVGKVKSHQQARPADDIDWLDLLETVLVCKLPQFTREEIKQMLGFNDVELKKTRFYQDVFGEGREEGEQEGVVKGEAALLLRQMESKFKSLSESARKRVAEAAAETLLV